MAHLGPYKQHGAGVLASSYASSATNAGSRIHGHICLVFRNRDRVGIGHAACGGADVTSRLDNLVKGRAVHNQITNDGESLSAPWLNPNILAILEFSHVELTGGDAIVVAVRSAINIESAHATDALPTVVVETDGMSNMVVDEPLIQDVKHLKKRAVRRDIINGIGLEMAFGSGVLLTPDM